MTEFADGVDLSLEQFFTENSWIEMSNFEKRCYTNKKINYEFFLNLGLNPDKPDFMKKVKNRKYLNKFKEENRSKEKKEESVELKEKVSKIVQSKKNNDAVFPLKQTSKNFGEKSRSCKTYFQNLMPRTEAYLKNLEILQELLERQLEKLEGNGSKENSVSTK
ncbi:hypothetical protein AVEN_270598-1 [Araneus ventricosus]|uniref:KRAB-related domain-containing protein n=1 Tax=Araneus ventricosus TaxID=182803 RepID=A0A4Y2DIV3_ARAVE|nr:hypothetical protein AVEN_270598-1 [Araneus ventricosus]